eukprot:3608221-Prorocentrum_lima.AAC.1
MTSSLVGSEMCIRDSPLLEWRSSAVMAALNPIQTKGSSALLQYLNMTRRPVSYTHLTLPTICSV